MSPVLGRPPRALRSHPVKPGAQAPGGGERHHGVGKADRSTESDRTVRGAAHHAGPRGTPERHAAGHNQGTRTGAKQQQPPGAANPESAHNTQRTTAQEQMPSNTSCRPDGRVRAQRQTSPCRLRNSCRPDGRVRARMVPSPCRLRNSRRPDGRVCARRVPSPCRQRTAVVRMDECAPRSAPPHTQYTAQHTKRTHW